MARIGPSVELALAGAFRAQAGVGLGVGFRNAYAALDRADVLGKGDFVRRGVITAAHGRLALEFVGPELPGQDHPRALIVRLVVAPELVLVAVSRRSKRIVMTSLNDRRGDRFRLPDRIEMRPSKTSQPSRASISA